MEGEMRFPRFMRPVAFVYTILLLFLLRIWARVKYGYWKQISYKVEGKYIIFMEAGSWKNTAKQQKNIVL